MAKSHVAVANNTETGHSCYSVSSYLSVFSLNLSADGIRSLRQLTCQHGSARPEVVARERDGLR